MAKLTKLSSLDTRGRLNLPQEIRKALSLDEGQQVMLIADDETESIEVMPFRKNARIVKLRLVFGDAPGSLAKAAAILAKHKIDLLRTESHSLKRGNKAEWVIIADKSKCANMAKLKKELEKVCTITML